ncbi:MAG: VCBS repeat-containing protein, partial [Akkermansiaceae bacterium]|nr:VCBS repeat-containing protein [Akkermansiaceae bacterium]
MRTRVALLRCMLVVIAPLLPGCGEDSGEAKSGQNPPPGPPAATSGSVERLEAERQRLDQTVFAHEVDAQRYEQTFVKLWDELRTGKPFEVFKGFQFEELVLGTPIPGKGEANWGVEGIRPAVLGDPTRTLKHPEFVSWLEKLESSGWRIVQSEWHHSQFEPADGGKPPRSIVSFEIHAAFQDLAQPVLVRGKLRVEWKVDGTLVPERIETPGVEMIARKGAPMFVESMVVDPKQAAPGRFPRTSPILVHDLDGDGLSEIVAAGCNLVYWNRGGFRFEKGDFLANPIIRPAEGGILADFTGDGVADYVGGSADDGSLLLFEGAGQGGFPDPPVACLGDKLANLHALTAGDIDGDGDLDLYLGQWKRPYADGAMPTPYYDANDGHPDYLLRNDGGGDFTDITAEAGLAPLRNRRTFSCSFLDLNGDHHLDLVVVADFSGLDVYHNRGDGTFA